MIRAAIAALAVLPTAVVPQAADWDIHRDARAGVTLAYTQFDNGLGVGFRCSKKGGFNAVVSGLPAATEDRYSLRVAFDGDEPREYRWTATTDKTVAVADYPASLARNFREGGDLVLTVPRGAPNGANLAYKVTLPASSAAIEQVLTECGKPLVDPRDAALEAVEDDGLPAGLSWRRAPRPRYPKTQFASGYAVVSCLSRPDGSLSDCETEMEHPFDSGFGQAALNGTRDARVQISDAPDTPVPLRRIGFSVNFQMR